MWLETITTAVYPTDTEVMIDSYCTMKTYQELKIFTLLLLVIFVII